LKFEDDLKPVPQTARYGNNNNNMELLKNKSFSENIRKLSFLRARLVKSQDF
jgi:hypothetical protein